MGSYEPPLDQLLRLDEEAAYGSDWPDYFAMGIGPRHIPDLIRLAADQDFNATPSLVDPDADSSSAYDFMAPVHAWRALGRLRAEEAIPVLVKLVVEGEANGFGDSIAEDMPDVFAAIGPAAIPPLVALLEDESAENHPRCDAVSSLGRIAEAHPELRGECVAILARNLERAEWRDRSLNAWIVSSLCDLKAGEAAGVIEKAFQGGFVDESICGTWYDVWHQHQFPGDPPPIPDRYIGMSSPIYPSGSVSPPGTFMPSSYPERSVRPSRTPVVTRAPEERKERNKSRKKREQKGKAKKGKRR